MLDIKMNYEEMSDFEINKEVALIVNDNRIFTTHGKVYLNTNNDSIVDYCNNPTDAWPIIVENKIKISPSLSVNKNKDTWIASDGWAYPESYHLDKNPLRAAMICFLKMKDEETNNE